MTEFPLPAGTLPGAIVAGPDGAIWFAERNTNAIARMTTSGSITRQFRIPSGAVDGLANGPDGALWFPQGSIGQIGRLDIGFDPPVTATGTTFEARRFVDVTRTVATFRDADPNARAGDYAVTIAWGDGSRTAGTVHRDAAGEFVVRGHHAYAKARTYRVVVRITDGVGNGLDAKVESTAIVHD